MFSFLATIIGIGFISEHLTEFIIGIALFVALIVYLVVRKRKRQAAYYALPVIFIGNKETRTYHSPSCMMLKKANPANLVNFRSSNEPVQYGYKRCNICKP